MKRSIEHSPRRLQLRRGFSLLELMIVVVLIAGILAIAWPS
ncbi:MAG: type IV pilin protein, partial [Pirellula sp.]